MSRLPLAPLLALALLPSAHAETPAPLAEPSAATAPAPSPASRPHVLSDETSARVAGRLPSFLRRAEPAAATTVDQREVDKPRNTIPRLRPELPPGLRDAAASGSDEPPPGVVRLPRYEVRDRKMPALKKRELLTQEAKIDLQFKKHPGLKIGNLFGLNRGIAAVMAAEDDDYERRLEMAELLGLDRFASAHPARDPDDAEPAPSVPAAPTAPAASASASK